MVAYNPRATMPEEAKLVSADEGHEHGYWGMVPDLADNEAYTVAGALKAEEQARKDHAKREAEWTKAASISEEKKPAPRRSSSAKKEDS